MMNLKVQSSNIGNAENGLGSTPPEPAKDDARAASKPEIYESPHGLDGEVEFVLEHRVEPDIGDEDSLQSSQ